MCMHEKGFKHELIEMSTNKNAIFPYDKSLFLRINIEYIFILYSNIELLGTDDG